MTGRAGHDNAKSSPSQRGGNRRPALRSAVRSAGNSPATSPAISRQIISKVKQKTLKDENICVTSVPETSSTPQAVADTNSCPCGVRNRTDVYKVDCSKCKRLWHQDCLTMGGLTGADIAKMVDYLCPFCYVPPAANLNPSPNICFTCKNTDNFRNLGLWSEIDQLSVKMEQFKQLNTQISQIDLAALMDRTATITNFDLHLQHILLNENKLTNYQDSVKTIESDIKTLSLDLASQNKLLTDSQVNSPPLKLEKLEQLCEKLSSELDEAKTYANICSSGTTVSSNQSASPKACSPNPTPAKKLKLEHSEQPVTDSRSEFLGTEKLKTLQDFLDDQKQQGKFVSEKGHAVLLFGKDYHYTGARSRTRGASNPIPGPISDVIEHI